MSHTPEPWKVEGDNILVTVANQGLSLLSIDQDGYAIIFSEEDARRIVACVNYCAGQRVEKLESDYKQGYEPWGHVKHLESQRDTAWQELREIREAIPANPEESTADEVRRVVAQIDKIVTALTACTLTLRAIARGEYCEGEESSMAQAALSKSDPITEYYTDRNSSGNAALST